MKNTQNQIEQGQELMNQLISKAWESAEFKNHLINNPEEAIKSVAGVDIELPEGKTIVVQDQSDDNNIYINIPAEPNFDEIELTDEQLEKVSGGVFPAIIAGLALGAALKKVYNKYS